MKRVLFIDDELSPAKANTEAGKTLLSFIESIWDLGYAIGPSDIAPWVTPINGRDGLSVYDRSGVEKIVLPRGNLAMKNDGSMFFTVDAAFNYFTQFVQNPVLWNDIDGIIIDIMMDPQQLLQNYLDTKHSEVIQQAQETGTSSGTITKKIAGYNDAGDYLVEYIRDLVAMPGTPLNPETILPVLVLTNKPILNEKGLTVGEHKLGKPPRPRSGGTNRLWIWKMTKVKASETVNGKRNEAFVRALEWMGMVGTRVK